MRMTRTTFFNRLRASIVLPDNKTFEDYLELDPVIFPFLDPDRFPEELTNQNAHWAWTRPSLRIKPPFADKRTTVPLFLYSLLYKHTPRKLVRVCDHRSCVSPFHMNPDLRAKQKREMPQLKPTCEASGSTNSDIDPDVRDLAPLVENRIHEGRAQSFADLMKAYPDYTREEIRLAINLMSSGARLELEEMERGG